MKGLSIYPKEILNLFMEPVSCFVKATHSMTNMFVQRSRLVLERMGRVRRSWSTQPFHFYLLFEIDRAFSYSNRAVSYCNKADIWLLATVRWLIFKKFSCRGMLPDSPQNILFMWWALGNYGCIHAFVHAKLYLMCCHSNSLHSVFKLVN